MPIGTSGRVQQLVTSDDLSLGIGKKREGVALLASELLGNIRRVNADGNWGDTVRLKLRKALLDTSQLEVAVRSPISAIENQQNGFRRRVARGSGE